MERLAERPHAVVELAQVLPVGRPAVSQHLRVLKEAGLVEDEPVGTRRIYRIDPAGVAALREQLDRYWGRSQPVNATVRRISSSFCAGVNQPRVCRGRPLSLSATSWRTDAEWTERSVPLGKYWRNR